MLKQFYLPEREILNRRLYKHALWLFQFHTQIVFQIDKMLFVVWTSYD